jgi:hypothetical protein
MRALVVVQRLAMAAAVLSMVGCIGSSAPKSPAWFLSPPDDPSYYVAAASAESMKEMIAINKAKTTAKADISGQIEERVGTMTKQFQEEVGTGEDSELLESFTTVTKTVSKTTLRGVVTREVQTMQRKNGSYVAYVLMVLPKAELAQQVLNEAKKQETLYQRFRASQAYGELQQELEDFEQAQ